MDSHHIDPYLRPAFSLRSRVRRFLWTCSYKLLFQFSPRWCFSWRAFVLRCWGGKLGSNTRIYPGAKIWAPWNLVCGDVAAIADGVIVYNPSLCTVGSHAIVSQDAYLCGATHDYNDSAFPLTSAPITVGDYAWICARAVLLPGVNVGEGAVLGLGSIASRDLEDWGVYAGMPARKVKVRRSVTASACDSANQEADIQ
jgi:putative colanic acid biosynthesis acetyltransferase WcaF